MIAALCGLGRAAYLAVQIDDSTVVEVAALARHKGRAGLSASKMSVGLPRRVDARAVLDWTGAGPVTVAA